MTVVSSVYWLKSKVVGICAKAVLVWAELWKVNACKQMRIFHHVSTFQIGVYSIILNNILLLKHLFIFSTL